MMLASEPTPCEVMFDVFKRKGGISHRALADIILSNRPLVDGRSPQSRAKDRSWLSHVIVHAPAGTHSERYYGDFGLSAARVIARLRTGNAATDNAKIAALLTGSLDRMERALGVCHQNAHLYRNALVRLLGTDVAAIEKIELEPAMLLFLAAGATSDVAHAVGLAIEYAKSADGASAATPTMCDLQNAEATGGVIGKNAEGEDEMPLLGLVRVSGDYVAGDINWLRVSDPLSPEPIRASADGEPSLVIGSLARGPFDVTDVGPSVSGEHARVYADKTGCLIEDLNSTNGTAIENALTHERVAVAPGTRVAFGAGDHILLGSDTDFLVLMADPVFLR